MTDFSSLIEYKWKYQNKIKYQNKNNKIVFLIYVYTHIRMHV